MISGRLPNVRLKPIAPDNIWFSFSVFCCVINSSRYLSFPDKIFHESFNFSSSSEAMTDYCLVHSHRKLGAGGLLDRTTVEYISNIFNICKKVKFSRVPSERRRRKYSRFLWKEVTIEVQLPRLRIRKTINRGWLVGALNNERFAWIQNSREMPGFEHSIFLSQVPWAYTCKLRHVNHIEC